MKRYLLLAYLILFVGVSAAQSSNTSINPEPGMVKAGGLVHGLDVAWDNALLRAGFKSPGEVAYERASEVAVARERNNTEAAVNAVDQFNDVVGQADNSDKGGLERAEQVLNRTSEVFPDQAEYGISNALENVREAKNRVPKSMTVEGRNDSGFLSNLPGGSDSGRNVPGGSSRQSRR